MWDDSRERKRRTVIKDHSAFHLMTLTLVFLYWSARLVTVWWNTEENDESKRHKKKEAQKETKDATRDTRNHAKQSRVCISLVKVSLEEQETLAEQNSRKILLFTLLPVASFGCLSSYSLSGMSLSSVLRVFRTASAHLFPFIFFRWLFKNQQRIKGPNMVHAFPGISYKLLTNFFESDYAAAFRQNFFFTLRSSLS